MYKSLIEIHRLCDLDAVSICVLYSILPAFTVRLGIFLLSVCQSEKNNHRKIRKRELGYGKKIRSEANAASIRLCDRVACVSSTGVAQHGWSHKTDYNTIERGRPEPSLFGRHRSLFVHNHIMSSRLESQLQKPVGEHQLAEVKCRKICVRINHSIFG